MQYRERESWKIVTLLRKKDFGYLISGSKETFHITVLLSQGYFGLRKGICALKINKRNLAIRCQSPSYPHDEKNFFFSIFLRNQYLRKTILNSIFSIFFRFLRRRKCTNKVLGDSFNKSKTFNICYIQVGPTSFFFLGPRHFDQRYNKPVL